MKSLFHTIALVVFSALILKPLNPKPYPPLTVIEQRREIIQHEQELDNLINTIEYKMAIDSLTIQEVKQYNE